jgi:hypothetical protein
MRKILLVLFAVSTITPAIADAVPIEALKSMAFLAGHCWKGEFPDSKQTDEHCFQWLYDGKALRDTHTVRAPGRPDYVGETTYYWDSAAKRVEYLYIENLGGISRGTMEEAPGMLVFPATQYVAGGDAMTFRARWTIAGDDAYEAWSEMQQPTGWKTMFKVKLKRVS